jgi:hypothetical protein
MNRMIKMSIYERLNNGETVDKAQLAFIVRKEYAVYGQIFKPTGLLKKKST